MIINFYYQFHLRELAEFFHPEVHADVCLGLASLLKSCNVSMSFWSSKYLVLTVSRLNLRVLMSFFAAVYPSWNEWGVPSKNVFRFGTMGWYSDSPPSFMETALLIFNEPAPPLILCSVRTNSSTNSFWHSTTQHGLFLSCSISTSTANQLPLFHNLLLLTWLLPRTSPRWSTSGTSSLLHAASYHSAKL